MITTFLVVAYAAGVLAMVLTTPEIGIHCTFGSTVGRINPDYFIDIDGARPEDCVGFTIDEIAGERIETWPHFLRALRDLSGKDTVPVKLRNPATGEVVRFVCQVGLPPFESLIPSILWLALELGMFVVGALVFWRRPDDHASGPFFALCVVAVGAYVGGYHWWQIPAQPLLMIPYIACAVLLPAVGLHFHVTYPRPKTWVLRWPRRSLLAIYALPVISGLLIAIGYLYVRLLFRSGESSDVIRSVLVFVRYSIYLAFAVAAVLFTAGIGCLVHSHRTARDSNERHQVRWILGGSLLASLPVGYSLYLVLFQPRLFASGGATWPMFIASACITAAFTVSITRYRLLRLDQIIGSGMVYFLVSSLAGLVYYLLVFAGMLIVGSSVNTGPSLNQVFWVSGTALILLLILDLLRGPVTRALIRGFRRDKRQLDRTLQQLSTTVGNLIDPPTLARKVLYFAGDLLMASQGAVFLRNQDNEPFRMTDVIGTPPRLTELAVGCPLVDALKEQAALTALSGNRAARDQLAFLGGEVAVALGTENRLFGFLLLGPKTTGFYSIEDFNILAAFAQITALGLQNAAGHHTIDQLNRELQAKVEKIAEQQGRILALQRQLVRQTEPINDPPERPKAGGIELVGSSAVIGRLLDQVIKVAASPSVVLIRGESGTGKELIARAIHDHSPRAAKPFVPVHCAALSPTLLESELFGHVKGAFTGAVADKPGRFEMANGGTIFLDEIGDVSLDVQTKLLRVLQDKTIQRVGSGEPITVDVRVVAATHQNLERLIVQERFREDLYYRLNVIPITVPPLRERLEDVPELVSYYLRWFAEQMGKHAPELEDEALASLSVYSWPGNVRELRNTIERAIVVAEGPIITVDDLPDEVTRRAPRILRPSEPVLQVKPDRKKRKEDRLKEEREQLVRALAEANGNKTIAARALGIPRSTLLSKLQRHGLQ